MFKFGIPTLVIRKFDVNENGLDGKYLEIIGRASGLISWILTLMKLDTLTTLHLEADRLSVKTSSLSGEIHTVIPLGAIESTKCGFSKSMIWLTLAVIVILGGLLSGEVGAFIGSLVVGAVFFVIYFLSNRMFISVAAGSETISIAFQKGIIEDVSVDLDKTLVALQLLNSMVVKEHAK